jgi:hypothetical protein
VKLTREVLPPRERPTIADIELIEISRRKRERDAQLLKMFIGAAIVFALCQSILRWFAP